jgi:membrane-bound serine protease (ClpP class)
LKRLRFCVSARTASALILVALAALSPRSARAEIPVVELTDAIHAVSAGHVVEALSRAEASGAPLVVIRIDTPGGLDSAMRQIIEAILRSKTPVAVFVGPSGARAASAGFLITVVADVAAMAPGTNIGAAHPVNMGGPMDETMSKKVTQDAAAYLRSKVAQRGRNAELAEKAITESMSFTEKEALEGKLIDLVAADIPALLVALEGREVRRFDGSSVALRVAGQRTVEVRMDWRQQVLSLIARPDVLFLLLLGALAGLGTEISHPGLLFPGILGTLCLILFLFASQILPVNWAGVLLILLAVALFVAEVKVASYGLLTLGGIVAMILGAMMLVDSDVPELRIAWSTLVPAALVMAAWSTLLVRLVVGARRRPVVTGAEGLVGQLAVALEDLSPDGWVLVQGEQWRAVAKGGLARGERARIKAVQGLTLELAKEE